MDAFHEFAAGRVFGHNRARFDRGGPLVEPETGLAFVAILPVAMKTVLGKDGPNVTIEIDIAADQPHLGAAYAGLTLNGADQQPCRDK